MLREKPLPWDEQLALFEAMRPPASLEARDAARNRIVETNVPMAKRVVAKFYRTRRVPRSLSFDDMVSVAYSTLLRAAETFDPSKGLRFTTHAYKSITLRLVLACEMGGRAFPLTYDTAAILRSVARARRAAGDGPSDDELMRSLGWSPRRRESAASVLRVAGSRWHGSAPDRGGDGGFHAWSIPDPSESAPDRAERAESARAEVGRLMRPLEPRHRRAVTLRYGLDGGGERPLREVAEGRTPEAARLWLLRAFGAMRGAAGVSSAADTNKGRAAS